MRTRIPTGKSVQEFDAWTVERPGNGTALIFGKGTAIDNLDIGVLFYQGRELVGHDFRDRQFLDRKCAQRFAGCIQSGKNLISGLHPSKHSSLKRHNIRIAERAQARLRGLGKPVIIVANNNRRGLTRYQPRRVYFKSA